jgi:predicted secreted hydrolase
MSRFFLLLLIILTSCAPPAVPASDVQMPGAASSIDEIPPGFVAADGSRPLFFPADFGAHDEFRTEWWYYTGNLQTAEARHFGFE